jgi:hypothetical protein
MKVSRTAFAVAGVYGVLLAAAAVGSWRFSSSPDEFVKLLAAWFSALTAALGAAVSLIVLLSQQKASAELERLKGEITSKVNSDLERLKGDITKSVKAVEFGMGQTARASETVSTALSSYYYALATLELGTYEDGDAKAAEMLMRQARARLIDLLPDARAAFDAFYQVGANIQGELRRLGVLTGQQDAMKKVWRDYVADFGGKLGAAEAALKASQDKAREGTP